VGGEPVTPDISQLTLKRCRGLLLKGIGSEHPTRQEATPGLLMNSLAQNGMYRFALERLSRILLIPEK